jgi:signal transduction histidine kinase
MLAKRVKDRPEALELIARIQNAQDHLHSLYEEVRTYAAPLNHLERQAQSLDELLRQTWEDLAAERQGRSTLLLQERGPTDLTCAVDPRRLGQVYRNVLENALNACPGPVEIRARWAETTLDGRPAVQLALRDNGPGLTTEARARIFEPFFTTKTQGTGLGMAIARRLVDAHGGTIAVGLPDGPGAEIIITLPRSTP